MRHDRLYDVRWDFLKLVTFQWISTLDKMKHKSAADVVTATAVTLLLVCRRFGLEPRRVMDTAERIVRRAEDVNPQYPRAISQYLAEEFTDE